MRDETEAALRRFDVDLSDLRMFSVVADELHFGRAATRLHLSQPGLSNRVQRLERALGYEVFARTTRSVRLTPAGEALLAGAQRLLGEASRVIDDAERVASGELATLRLGLVGTALYSMLPSVVRETRRRHPGLSIVVEELKTTAQVRALQRGQLDLGLLHLPVDPGAGLTSVPVLEDPVGIALPADHPLAGAEELDLADFAAEPFVLFPRALEPATYDRYTDACVSAGFAPHVAHQATGLPTILALVAAGLGVAFVAHSVGANLHRTGVVVRPLAAHAPRLVTGPAWRGELEPAAALLRDVVVDLGAAGHLDGSPVGARDAAAWDDARPGLALG